MSENENQPAPSKQTSSVPLKKETVRVTLKAADAPPAATLPGGAPVVRPPTPTGAPVPTALGGAPRPPAPAPTIPLRPAGAPTVPGAPTAPGGAPRPPGPAPTIPLRPAGTPTLPPGGAGAPGATVALPKATVQLQAPTQPLGTARPSFSQSATLQGEEEEEATGSDGISNALSVVGFLAALAVLAFQLMIANSWISPRDGEPGSWGQLFSSSAASE